MPEERDWLDDLEALADRLSARYHRRRPDLQVVASGTSSDPLLDRLTAAVDALEPPTKRKRRPSLTVVQGGCEDG